MRSIHKLIAQLRKSETGFTLVELLVVVGIIVALAAVIIPNVARFTGKGTEGAYAAEADNVQTAFDTLMADAGIAGIDRNDVISGDPAINNFAGFPTNGGPITVNDSSGIPQPVDLTDYLRGNPTTNFYCWDDGGLISSGSTWTSGFLCP